MSSKNNIVLIQNLFDKYIYSLYNEEQLINAENEEIIIENELSWNNIYEFFETKEDFFSAIRIYTGTIIDTPTSNGSYSVSLLSYSVEATNDGIHIKHDATGLRLYLYRQSNSEINNRYLQNTFKEPFERYKMNSDVLYSLLTKGYYYKCTPEELKLQLGINYINSMLKVKILAPAEKIVKCLFDEGKIPFYFKTDFERSIMGPGNRIIKINFETIDNILLLRLKRMRHEYMDFIISELKKLCPFDYPFIEEFSLKKTDDATIERIYKTIKYIGKDPDYNKLATPTLVKFKLRQDFNIRTDY